MGKPDARCWSDVFQHAWLASALDAVSQTDPEIRGFVGSTHGRYVDDFAHLDEERIVLAVDRVRRAHGERTIAAMNANPSGEQLIRAEAGKMERHLPLRRVFSQAADVLTAICPWRQQRKAIWGCGCYWRTTEYIRSRGF